VRFSNIKKFSNESLFTCNFISVKRHRMFVLTFALNKMSSFPNVVLESDAKV
jgi:hypothetical protein